jgi:transcriptional regulator with XRE-family HTH domain
MEDLWKIRRKKRMTVAQLSAKAGIPARLIKEYEAGIKTIPSQYLPNLARALYVDVVDIKPLSDPIPTPPPKARPPRKAPVAEEAPPPPKKKPKEKKGPPPAGPARPSQIDHLLRLAERLQIDRAALEEEVGYPLEELTRPEASRLLNTLQERIAAEKPPKIKKQRGYLPETVDTFELKYLTQKQYESATLVFTLFDGKVLTGTIIGFSPYAITIEEEGSGEEITIQKLAIAYYRKKAEVQAK